MLQAAIHALKMKLEGETGDMIREEQGVLARERIHIKQEEERRRVDNILRGHFSIQERLWLIYFITK